MQNFTKQLLSESVDGIGFNLANSRTLLHVPPQGTTTKDEVWLYAKNLLDKENILQIMWAHEGEGAQFTITCHLDALEGLKLVVPGLIVQNAKQVSAFCTEIDENLNYGVGIVGFVNRIRE